MSTTDATQQVSLQLSRFVQNAQILFGKASKMALIQRDGITRSGWHTVNVKADTGHAVAFAIRPAVGLGRLLQTSVRIV